MILVEPYQVDAITPEGLPTKRRINLGKYKQTPNHVKTKTGEMFYFATPEETPAKMGDLMDWYKQMTDNQEIPAFLTAALLHYKFIRIHPFDDGNGRMARILMNLVLMMNGLPPVIIKSEKKEAYYQALQMADGGDESSFVAYIGEQVLHSQELYLKGANGEDIEELDDIDKEIALLKKSLAGEEEKITLNRTIQVDSYKKVIHPLFAEVLNKLAQFDELFFKVEIMLWENNAGGLVADVVDFMNKTNYSFYDKENAPLNIGFEYKWLEFKKNANFNFLCIISLHCSFEVYNFFTISSKNNVVPLLLINYDNIYINDAEVKKIANALAKDVLEQIKKQLNPAKE
jgi:fido (protein-threonine AMPylation protein)